MSVIDKNYHQLLETIITDGYTYEDPNRKGVKRLEIPNYTFRHEFKDGFPAISTKKLHYKNVVTELIWFLRGDTNIKYLVDNGCNIWNKDAYNYYLKSRTKEKYNECYCGHTTDCECGTASIDNFIDGIKNGSGLGDLGPVYGAQWREIYDKKDDDISRYDQIKTLINTLKNSPLGTQHIVNAWNVLELDDMALQPCHYGFQVVVRPLSYQEQSDLIPLKIKNKGFYNFGEILQLLNIPKYGFEIHWQQRSVDTFLGLPFNIASYATLALILEKITGYKALAIQGDLKKVHLYDNSLDAVKEQLSRDYDKYYKCNIIISQNGNNSLNNYEKYGINRCFESLKPEMFSLENYESYPGIRVEMLERDE